MVKKIALTGSIGSGKSSVSKILAQYGYCVWDADVFSKEVLFFPEVETQVKTLFGKEIFLEKGKLNRELVRKMIFNDPPLKKVFESILHPAIAKHFASQVNTLNTLCHTAWVFYEASLIFETKRNAHFDACIVVTASEQVRTQRILNSRKISQEEVKKIMESQMPDSEKIKQADQVIDNSGDLKSLEMATQKMISFLHNKFIS